MKIIALDGRSPASSRLYSQVFAVGIHIRGLAAEQLRYLFGAGGSPFDWTALVGSTIEVQLEQGDAGSGPVVSIDLGDARVETRSGGPARLYIEPCHQLKADRFPDSLALALAQQWARAGLCMLHAAGVVINGRGHLLLGDKGHGKSTLGAAALANGGKVVSDDWLLVGSDVQAGLCMERLRGFIMLRQGWAAERLQQSLEKPLQPHSRRPRLLLASRNAREILPGTAPVHAVWLLRRRGGWPARTRRYPAKAAETLAGLISANVPVLHSNRFPAEHQKINATLANLIARLDSGLLYPGLDLIEPAADQAHPLTEL